MTGAEFKAIRENLGLDAVTFCEALGYEGKPQTHRSKIYQYERGRWTIPPTTAMLAIMLDRYGVPEDTWFSGNTLTRLINMCWMHGVAKELLAEVRS